MEKRMGSDDDGCFTKTLVAMARVGLIIAASLSSYQAGFNRGVEAHADGRYVVVSMPDGTRVVSEVKEAKP